MSRQRPVITVFSSIKNIAPSLKNHPSNLPLQILEDDSALGGFGGTVVFDPSKLQSQTRDALHHAEILVTEPHVLAALLLDDDTNNKKVELKHLKWCQSTYAGVDPLFTEQAKRDLQFPLPFTLTRFAGAFGPPIAEWCMARILQHERRFELSRMDQEQTEWVKNGSEVLSYRYLSDLTLAILGCGDIGLCIARMAKQAFGMTTIGYSTSLKKEPMALDHSVTSLTDALKPADYVISVLPSTATTRGILTKDVFYASCHVDNEGKAPVFLNVGRGDVTSTNDIIHALDQGSLSAAILDVFEEEPLPKDNPLWTHPKVTVSPHVSGLTRGQDVPNLVVENYNKYVQGEPLQYVVDWNKTY